jgi:predicted transcriptional regulator
MASKTVSVRLDPETLERLGALSKAMDRPRAWLMAHAIRHYVENQAWQIEAIQHAVDRLEKGKAKFIDHEKVEEWVNSWGTDDERETPKCV